VGTADQEPLALSRRERQIMDILFRLGRATAQQVLDELSDPPSYSAVRAHLAALEGKGLVAHESDGPRYVYFPNRDVQKERRQALRHLVQTFFAGSAAKAAAALLDEGARRMSNEDLDALLAKIERARRKDTER
jgi:predicted transcriptional regulator